MNQELKQKLEEITKQLGGEIKYYKGLTLREEYQKIEIVYEKTVKKSNQR